jgi:hypothetical protein
MNKSVEIHQGRFNLIQSNVFEWPMTDDEKFQRDGSRVWRGAEDCWLQGGLLNYNW